MANMILIVEDEEAIRDLIRINLTAAGFSCEEAEDGLQALAKAKAARPDLILLDWMLPGLDGLGVQENDIVLGLEMGASDYVTKPFSNKVLIARIRALLRRGEEDPPEEIIRYASLTLIPGQRRAVLAGQELSLTCGEFDLLALLSSRPGHVYTRSQIVARTKGEDYPVTDRAVDVQVVNLRRKLGPFGERLETVRGVGYRMRG